MPVTSAYANCVAPSDPTVGLADQRWKKSKSMMVYVPRPGEESPPIPVSFDGY